MIVFYFACLYWGGVVLNAARIRIKTGKLPSLRPRSILDHLLWAAWASMIVLWAGAPWFTGEDDRFFHSGITDVVGMAIAGCGVIGTWWCYVSMGSAWAISQDKGETRKLVRSGPFGLVRHPIYTFQWVIVGGLFLVLPGLPLLASLVILTVCMQVKARAEERGLAEIFGDEYAAYCKEVGRFVPGGGR